MTYRYIPCYKHFAFDHGDVPALFFLDLDATHPQGFKLIVEAEGIEGTEMLAELEQCTGKGRTMLEGLAAQRCIGRDRLRLESDELPRLVKILFEELAEARIKANRSAENGKAARACELRCTIM